MLWRIKNFKGVGTAEIDIRPGKATVLTGVNSSGKSSIIQSLLLIAQSLQNENRVVLNGPLVRLGDAQDLVREGAEQGAIELGIGLEEATGEDGAKAEGLQAVFDLVPADDRSTLRARSVGQ
ncbi:AAA family ATPase [Lacisediminihabitans sp.]|jgi:predicted ATPase|uniref:AAA family ATPase n=1 Tax=Lacisediminihabitans sp. TaxID=2787631 RepID=UPI002F93C43A